MPSVRETSPGSVAHKYIPGLWCVDIPPCPSDPFAAIRCFPRESLRNVCRYPWLGRCGIWSCASFAPHSDSIALPALGWLILISHRSGAGPLSISPHLVGGCRLGSCFSGRLCTARLAPLCRRALLHSRHLPRGPSARVALRTTSPSGR